jgi:phage major head subunit gpT-like protein
MPIVNITNLNAFFTGTSALFNRGFEGAPSYYEQVATVVPSSARDENYGWMGSFPALREWLGNRVINNLSVKSYTVTNKPFESTISIPRDDFEDDRVGVFSPMFQEMGRSAKEFPDTLVFNLLKQGFTSECYDGQFFFDTDHPVGDANNPVVSVANTDGGSGAPWFLLDTSRAIKPLIYQQRRPFNTLIRKDQPDDENVFLAKELIYGVDGRANAGFGLWQLAWGSMQTLDAAHYASARAAMAEMKGDTGRILGVRPDTLVVPPSLEGAALDIVNSATGANGATNKWKGTAKLIVVPWLA